MTADRPLPSRPVRTARALALLLACAVAAPAAAQSGDDAKSSDKPPRGVARQLSVIDAKLDRIAVALEAQQEMAQLELMLRRVESAERRIDTLEAARLQARTYLGTLSEKRIAAEGVLETARERVKTGWPPGPRTEALQARDEAQTQLEQIAQEIATIESSLATIEVRIAELRDDSAAWSTMLESRLAALASTPPAASLATPTTASDSQ